MSRVGFERQVAEFINDQQFRPAQQRELLIEIPVHVGFGQKGHERCCRHELNRVVLPDRLTSQRHRQVRFPRPGRPQEQRRVTVRDPAARRQFPDLPWIQRRLRIELEAVEFAHEGELGDLARHGDPAFVAPSDFASYQERERFAQGHVRACGLVEQRIQLIADCRQLQPVQHGDEGLVIDCHHHAPPTTASYSASGRNSAGGATGGIVARAGAAPTSPARCARSMTR